MPENFYEWVLDLERQIETLKNKTPEGLIKALNKLYLEAIEFHASKDQH